MGKVARAKGIGYGTASLYTKRAIAALNMQVGKWISWPSATERKALSIYNEQTFGFPGCISSTDGTHIVLFQRPGLQGEVYWSRKCQYSMNVILTFDHKRQIRYIIAGWPGSVHDTKAWESGEVHKHPGQFFSPGEYQLGDSGFSLNKQMLVPYRQPAAAEPANEAFNKMLSKARVVSEHGNGVLKGRWQSLRGLPVCINKQADVKSACDWIMACCILHNMVNSCQREADDIECYQDRADAELGGNESDIPRIGSIGMSEADWRRDVQKKVLDFCGFC